MPKTLTRDPTTGRVAEVFVPDVAASVLAAAGTSSAITYAATALALPVVAGATYLVTGAGSYATAATTTGIGLQLGGLGGLTAAGARIATTIWGVTATTATTRVDTALTPGAAKTTGVAAANTAYPWALDGVLRVGTAGGTLQLEFASEVLLSTVTLHPDSYLRLERIA